MSAGLLDFRREDSCPPQARSSVTAVYTGTMGPQNLSICQVGDGMSDHENNECMQRIRAAFNFRQRRITGTPAPASGGTKSLPTPAGQTRTFRSFHQDVQELLPAAEGQAVPYIGSWGQCGAGGGHLSCCLGDLYGASLRSHSLMARW